MGAHRGEELGRRKGLATAWQAAEKRGGGSSVGSGSRKGEQVWDLNWDEGGEGTPLRMAQFSLRPQRKTLI